MTRWGALLLLAYLVLGLSNVESRKAVQYAVVVTAAVLLFEGLRTGAL